MEKNKGEIETGRVLILKNRSGAGKRLLANVCFDNKTGTIYLKEQKKQEVEDGEKD